jgi:hypothetical protein
MPKMMPSFPHRSGLRGRSGARPCFPTNRIEFRILLCLTPLLLCLGAVGCKSGSLSCYVSPRVTGRVVDADTQQPIEGVKVQRLSANQSYLLSATPPRGGQRIDQPPFVRSGSDGRFTMDSRQDLAPFGNPGWYSVSLYFEHPGYNHFSTSYTVADATNSVSGEPVVNAGDIPLVPSKK